MLKSVKAWLSGRGHAWAYRNPYDRTCDTCGRHEVQHYRGVLRNSWWEVFEPGISGKSCSEKDA